MGDFRFVELVYQGGWGLYREMETMASSNKYIERFAIPGYMYVNSHGRCQSHYTLADHAR